MVDRKISSAFPCHRKMGNGKGGGEVKGGVAITTPDENPIS